MKDTSLLKLVVSLGKSQTMQPQTEKSCIFMGAIPIGALFFMRLENAFLLAESKSYIEIISDFDNLENDLKAFTRFKGESFIAKNVLNTTQKTSYCYLLQKQTPSKMQHFHKDLHFAPPYHGLAPNGVTLETGCPEFHFNLSAKNEIWSNNLEQIYNEAKSAQWDATKAIQWQNIPSFSPSLEFAIAQIMTYLAENEFSALYIPSRFLGQISPYFTPIPLLLSSIIGDEARHIEAFIKRAHATGLGVQYSTRITQQSLYSLWNEKDYFKSSFLLHIMGEGTFIDLLKFLQNSFEELGDKASSTLLYLARRDETRHVAYGMHNVKNTLANNPHKINLLKEAVFARKHYLDNSSGESSLLLESLTILKGGGNSSTQIANGFEAVMELKKKMEKNRTKRLVECGIDEDLANDLSKAHTPNFM